MTLQINEQNESRVQGNADDFSIYRWSRRYPVKLDAELYHDLIGDAANAKYLGTFKTRDLDSRGMFVETASVKLKPGDVVFIRVVMDVNGRVKNHWLRGIVARRSFIGVGVWYSDTQSNEFFRDLSELLE